MGGMYCEYNFYAYVSGFYIGGTGGVNVRIICMGTV